MIVRFNSMTQYRLTFYVNDVYALRERTERFMSRMGWDRIEDQEIANEDPGVRGRLILLRVFIVVIFGLLIYRIYWMQQTKGEELQTLAEENQFAHLTQRSAAWGYL